MDNAAARVLSILEKARLIDTNKKCRAAFRELFEVSSDIALTGKLGKFLATAEDAASKVISTHSDQTDAVRHWQTCIYNLFVASNAATTWNDALQLIDNHAINYLKLHALLLEHDSTQKDLTPETLKRIRDLAEEAMSQALGSQLDPAIKYFLREKLNEIIDAIDDYKITGFKAVFDRSNALAGLIAQLPSETQASVANSDSGKSVLSTIKCISDVAAATSKASELGQSFLQLMGTNS